MKVTAEDLRNVWNANRGELPRCDSLDVLDRRKIAQAMVDEVEGDLPRLARSIQRVAASDFCNGRVPTKESPAGFFASFDWFIRRKETLILIEEGTFDMQNPIQPPDTPSPADLSYWTEPKPSYHFSDDEFLRCQIQGRLCLAKERATKQKSMTRATKQKLQELSNGHFISDDIDDFCQDWITNGGQHPWASDAQIAAAKAYVMKARGNKNDPLPSSFAEFRIFRKIEQDF